MKFPREVVAGSDVLYELGKLCREFKLKGTGLLITGHTTRKIAGETVYDILTKEKFDVHMVEAKNSTVAEVRKCENIGIDVNAGFIIGVGGGSKIDIAKLCATHLKIPFISVPTSASHDGIASPRASIKNSDYPFSIEATVPLGVVADTKIIVKAPYRMLASGCADVIANATAVKDWELATRLRNEEFSSTAHTLAKYTADTIIENASKIKPNLEESIWITIKPMIISGISMSIAGTSRPTSGSEHMFSHALSMVADTDALHGEQCGIGTIMMMYLHGGDWISIRDALEEIGAPTTAKQLNVPDEKIIDALVRAHTVRRERYTVLGDKGLTPEAARKLAITTKVIEGD